MSDVALELRAGLADRYTIERELGRGGMATVYLARDLKHHRPVALKVLRPELGPVLGGERFLREIEIIAQQSHPNILPLYDSGEVNGHCYYVMPFVEGESLRDRLRRERQLPLDETIRLTREVADALEYAHRRGVVHRDIKPENILLSGGESPNAAHALVTDFGIARAVASSGASLTETGFALGTPAYMSPEQAAASDPIDGRTDVYALSCVVYELLSGHPPFLGASGQELMVRHAIDPVPPLRSARPDLPAAVEDVIRKGLAKSPADRFASAAAFSQALEAAVNRRRSTGGQGWIAAATGVLLLATLGLIWWNRRPRPPSAVTSIAVLPFVNLSGNSDDLYLSDGIADELGTALHRVPGLRVVGWTSASRYRDRRVDMKQIAAELKVGTLLDATIRRSGSRVRVHAQLLRGKDGDVVWQDEYEREVKDVFAVQDEIARAIVSQLRLTLASPGAIPNVRRPVVGAEAHNLYLKGKFFLGQRSPPALRKSIEYFNQALRVDSTYAAAYSGVSDAYSILSIALQLDPHEGFGQARRAAEKALAFDSASAEAETSLAIVSTYYDWDPVEGERHAKRALTLDPQYDQAHLFLAWARVVLGDTAGAIEEVRRARELSPVSAHIQVRVASMLYFAHRYDEALAELRRANELDSASVFVPAVLAQIYYQQDRCEPSVVAALRVPYYYPFEGFVIGPALARCGRLTEAVKLLAETKDSVATRPLLAQKIALLYLGLGEKDSAFAWFERARAAHDPTLVLLPNDPSFDPIRSDPRYTRLLREMRLAP